MPDNIINPIKKDPVYRLVIAMAYLAYRKRKEEFRFRRKMPGLYWWHVSIWNLKEGRVYINTDLNAGHSEILIRYTDCCGEGISQSYRYQFEDPDFIRLVRERIDYGLDLVSGI